MTNRCTFKQGLYNCGSHAFNLYKENIEQGDYCDQHYWEDRAMKAEALVDTARADEREACAKVCETLWDTPINGMATEEECYGNECAAAIRARGTT